MEYQVYLGVLPIGWPVSIEQANDIKRTALQYMDNVRIVPIVNKPKLIGIDGGKGK